jgi:hypothetical protein
MAERPLFVPVLDTEELVKEIFLQLTWHSGFAAIQKEKNIKALHEAAAEVGFSSILEVSSKSDSKRGRHLSAFHMRVKVPGVGEIPLECAFQGSKVFEHGGPFTDIYAADVREAKRDARLKGSGRLTGFLFDGFLWPLEPKTAFYDWLYVTFLSDWRDWAQKLFSYSGFTDIEFNPHKSINCQARSCALFLALMKRNLLDESLASPASFISVLSRFHYRPQLRGTEAPLLEHRDSRPSVQGLASD